MNRPTYNSDAIRVPPMSAPSPNRESAWSGLFALAADTSPEAGGPLAAPPGCETPDAYRAALRWRYRNSPAARQQLAVIARHVQGDAHRPGLPITGPFAHEARAILDALCNQPEEQP